VKELSDAIRERQESQYKRTDSTDRDKGAGVVSYGSFDSFKSLLRFRWQGGFNLLKSTASIGCVSFHSFKDNPKLCVFTVCHPYTPYYVAVITNTTCSPAVVVDAPSDVAVKRSPGTTALAALGVELSTSPAAEPLYPTTIPLPVIGVPLIKKDMLASATVMTPSSTVYIFEIVPVVWATEYALEAVETSANRHVAWVV
jgi:hypothetical protein